MTCNLQQVESLILRQLTEGLPADDQKQLATMLEASPAARQLLASHLQIEASVLRLGRGQEISPSQVDVIPADLTTSVSGTSTWQWIAVASIAMAVVVAGIALFWRSEGEQPRVAPSTKAVAPMASLTRSVNAVWAGEPLETGAPLISKTVSLDEGVAEIQFSDGATVILEGPAILEIVSSDQGFLHRGRLHSIVPPEAFGFSIASRTSTVVDLGTEFGLDVDDAGATEVHVFDGEVEVYEGPQHDGRPQLIAAGEALRYESTGEPSVMLADASFFIGTNSLELRSVAFINELDGRLAALQRQQRDLQQQEKNRASELRNSPKLKKLRSRVDDARGSLLSASREMPNVQDAEAAKAQARSQLERTIDRKLAQSDSGKSLIEKRNELNQQIDDLRQEMSGLGKTKADRATKKLLAKELQRAVRERSQKSQKLRKLRQNIRKTDGVVKSAMKDFAEKRRLMNAALSDSAAPKLHKKWKSYKRRLSQEMKRVMNEDEGLNELRMERRRLADEIKSLRRKLRNKSRQPDTVAASATPLI